MRRFLLLLAGMLGNLASHAAMSAGAGEWQLDFSGSHRSRFSTLSNQFRPGLGGGDQALSMRTLIRVEAANGPLSLVGELLDARNYLNDDGSALSTIEINTLEPLQAFVAWNQDSFNVKAGVFTLNFGSQRLVARHGWRNTIQNYRGVQAGWKLGQGGSVSTFWVLPVSARPFDLEGLLDNAVQRDHADSALQLQGVFADLPLPANDLVLETYLYRLQEEDKAGESGTPNREIYTPGIRLLRVPAAGKWDVELELAWQWGSRRETSVVADTDTRDVKASFLHAAAGYSFDAPWRPRAELEWTRASGDRNPLDGRYERFDSLFGPRREYGPTGIYGLLGRNNLQTVGMRLTLTPGDQTDLMASLRSTRLVSAMDSFASTGVRDSTGAAGKEAGSQVEFTARRWFRQRTLHLEAGGAFFDYGDFFEKAPNATKAGDPAFFYVDLSYVF